MWKNTILIILTFFSITCQKQKNINNYKFQKKEIKVNYNSFKFLDSVIVYRTDTSISKIRYFDNFLILYIKDSLIFFDIHNKNLYRKVSLPYKGELNDFYYHNKDSIFLLYLTSKYTGYQDSILQMIDLNGNLKKVYSFENTPVYCSYNNVLQDTAIIVYNMLTTDLVMIKNKIYLGLGRYQNYLGDKKLAQKPILGYMDIQKDTFFTKNINYPELNYGKDFYPLMMSFFSFTPYKDNLYISFQYTDKTLIYNSKTKKIDTLEFESAIIDSILPVNDIKKIPKDYSYFSFYGIHFNYLSNSFFRYLLLPFDKYGIGNYYLEEFDTLGKLISIIKIPKKDESLLFINGDTLYTTIAQELNKGNLIINKYLITYKIKSNLQIISDLDTGTTNSYNFQKYLKNKIKAKNYAVTIIWYDMMCENISDFIIKNYQLNANKYISSNIYLMIITEDTNSFKKEFFLNYNFNEKNIIIFENYKDIVKFIEYDNIPRVLVVENNKILTDTIFDVNEITDKWQKFLKELTLKQKK